MAREVVPGADPGESVWSLDMLFRTARFGQPLEQISRFRSRERSDGRILECGWSTSAGPDEQSCRITVVGEQATIEFQTSPAAPKSTRTIPWPAGTRGYFAVEQSLLTQPMKANEKRSLVAILPLLNQIGKYVLQAQTVDNTTLLDRDAQLLAIHVTVATPTTDIVEYQVWTDTAGRIMKQETEQTQQTILATDRATALAPSKDGLVDIGFELLIPVDGLPTEFSSTMPITYLFTFQGRKFTTYFKSSAQQSVSRLPSGDVRVTVWPESTGSTRGQELDQAQAELLSNAQRELYTASTSLVQASHADIVELARSALPHESQLATVARALERLVHERIAIKDYSRAFASALDVARNGHGDCTEHAVLLAALCRARGIPARGVFGLLAMPSRKAFVFHMWTEVWIDDHWLALDATLGRGGTTTGHLKLWDSALEEGQLWSDILPLMALFQETKVRVE